MNQEIEVAEGCGLLCVLDESGHTETQWSVADMPTVEKAKGLFLSMKVKGYVAYKMGKGKGGEDGEVVEAFDPAAKHILMRAPMVGG